MLEQNQNKIISNEMAAAIGLVLMVVPVIYWLLIILSGLRVSTFAYEIVAMLPRNFWVVNFVISILVWKINRMSIWIDRFGEWEGLVINKLLINGAFLFFWDSDLVFIIARDV
jgi:hypothetical protein